MRSKINSDFNSSLRKWAGPKPSDERPFTFEPPEKKKKYHHDYEHPEITKETLLQAFKDTEKEIKKLNQRNLVTRLEELRVQVTAALDGHSDDIKRLNAEIVTLNKQVVKMLKTKNDELNNENERLVNKLAVAQAMWKWEAHLARFVTKPRIKIYEYGRFKQMQKHLPKVKPENNLWTKIQKHYGQWTTEHWEMINIVRNERNGIAHPDLIDLDLVESEILKMSPDFQKLVQEMLAMLKTTASLMKFGRLAKFFRQNKLFPSGNVGSEVMDQEALKDIISWDRKFEEIDGLQNMEHKEAKEVLAKYVNQPERITQYFLIVDFIKRENETPLGRLAWEFEIRSSSGIRNEEIEALIELKKLAPKNESTARVLDATIAKLHIPDFLPKHLWKHGLKIVEKYSKL